MIITDEHINDIEKILLPEGCFFDDERRKFIKCIGSRDVSACAGSGKTTALIAKLMILDKYFLPFPQNKGICILTHTNVAIDEVKERLGSNSKLLKYPNFFGTIQSFVNKYLAVPMYVEGFGKRPTSIDGDLYNTTIEIIGNFLLSDSNQKHWLSAKGWLSNKNEPIKDLKQIRFSLNNKGLENWELLKHFNGDSLFKSKKDAYNNFYNIKYETLLKKRGLLHYDDAYTLANLYIFKHQKELQELFTNRFQFVFIDEMQDSYQHQIDIFDKIFDKTQIIYQCIGDPNQAIYNSANNAQVWQPQNPLYISESRRFSTKIASAISNIRLDIKTSLKGNSDKKIIKDDGTEEEISPYVVLFDDDKIKDVIVKFKDLIIDYKLHLPKTTNQKDNKKNIFKAIGWVGQDKDKTNTKGQLQHCIKHYFDENQYKKESKILTTFDNLSDYLLKQDAPNKNGKKYHQSTKTYKDALVNVFLNVLRITGTKQDSDNFRNYTSSTFWKKVNSDKEFKKQLEIKLFEWCQQIIQDNDIKDDVINYIRTDLKDFFQYGITANLNTFLNNASKLTKTTNQKIKNQVEFKDTDEKVFKIDIATIHSVKGETHTGTLYLETFKNEFETQKGKGDFKDCLKRCEVRNNKFSKQKRLNTALKMAYVGMSRPTHLLCVALHKSSFDNLIQDIQDLENVGWKVIQL
jgi:superfamily I DNA/RNA helicase